MTFNKHMTNEEVVYKLNYAYTCNQENFHKMLEITKERLDKLTELENIEEELGIDLITLFKALSNGFYYKCYDNTVMESFTPAFKENCIYVDDELDEFVEPRDYGKTWALTKEELENE